MLLLQPNKEFCVIKHKVFSLCLDYCRRPRCSWFKFQVMALHHGMMATYLNNKCCVQPRPVFGILYDPENLLTT